MNESSREQMGLAQHTGALRGRSLVAAGQRGWTGDNRVTLVFDPARGELAARANSVIEADEAGVVGILITSVRDIVQRAPRIGDRPEPEKPLRNRIGNRGAFRGGRDTRRTYQVRHL